MSDKLLELLRCDRWGAAVELGYGCDKHIEQVQALAHRIGLAGDHASNIMIYGRDTPALQNALVALRELELKLLESLEL